MKRFNHFLIIISFFYYTVMIFILFGCSDSKQAQNFRDMIFIPAGEFKMGSTVGEGNTDQHPLHTVYLDAYYIDKFEVTNKQYEEFILAGGYQKKEYWTNEGWDFVKRSKLDKPLGLGRRNFDNPEQPVVGVSWYEANAYCRWAGKRLPTEAEWEKAARGTNGRRYPWGNEMDFSRISYRASNGRRTVVVGSFPSGASPYGVQDCAGNVWEWCWDYYSENYYKESPKKNPKGPRHGIYRVLRGGSWGSNRVQMQCSYRYYDKPDRTAFNIGFRCARDGK